MTTSTVKAFVRDRYGGPEVLALRPVGAPSPTEGRVVVRLTAAAINPVDWHLLTGKPFVVRVEGGLRRPKQAVLGTDLAGRIESVGPGVTRFRPGDEVFGTSAGTLAELVRAREANLVHKPHNISFEQAAAVPVAALTALQGLRDKGRMREGHHVLIVGASGGVGTFAVQIAKALGAEVTAVCRTRNVDLVRSLGADHVIDYTRDDFTKSPTRYDVILDAVGDKPFRARMRMLTEDGMLVLVAGPVRHFALATAAARFTKKPLTGMLTKIKGEDLVTLRDLLAEGKVTPVVDRVYPFEQVPEALAYQGEGHTRGKIVVRVTED